MAPDGTKASAVTDTMTFVMAGGAGERLRPLTVHTPKPLVPFGGVFRILDFTLSNCRNSRLRNVAVLSQFESPQIGRHLDRVWRPTGSGVAHRPSQPGKPYRGTADAVRHNLELALDVGARDVLVLSADHVYQADYRDLIGFHRDSGADVTVSAVRVPVAAGRHFGVLEADRLGTMTGFVEKPADPARLDDGSGELLASMGVYVLGIDTLIDVLVGGASFPAAAVLDFGKDVIPRVLERRHVMAWEFRDALGGEAFWRDVGTLDAYHEAHMAALDPHSGFDPFDRAWPAEAADGAQHEAAFPGSFVPARAAVHGDIRRSVLSPGVSVGAGADVEDAVLMHHAEVGPGSIVRRAVIGPGVEIPAGETIGLDPLADRERFPVTPNGIVVIDDAAMFGGVRARPTRHAYA